MKLENGCPTGDRLTSTAGSGCTPRSPTAAGSASSTPRPRRRLAQRPAAPSSASRRISLPTTSARSRTPAWSPGTGPRPTGAVPTCGSTLTGLTGLGPDATTAAPVPRVVFVCTANTARSQLAAALWSRASSVPATSAGTHPAEAVAAGAAAVAAARPRLAQVTPRHVEDVLRTATSSSRSATTPTRSWTGAPPDSRTPRPPAACTGRCPTRSPPAPARPSTPPTTTLARRVTHLAPHLAAS